MPTFWAALATSVFLETSYSTSSGRKLLAQFADLGHGQAAIVRDDGQLGLAQLAGQFVNGMSLLRCWQTDHLLT